MDGIRTAPLAGIAACLATLAALAYPFLTAGAGAGAYYGSGVVNPLVGALLVAVAVIVFAAGREGRSDPGFAAGATLAFGAVAALILLAWAATVRVDVVAVSASHRWVTAAAGLAIPATAVWYARSLGLV